MTNTPSRGCSDVVKGEAIAPGFWAYFTKSWVLTMNGVGFLNINPKGKDNPDNFENMLQHRNFPRMFSFPHTVVDSQKQQRMHPEIQHG